MAVITEHPYIDEFGVTKEKLIRTYSDEGKRLIQIETGIIYEEAIDVYPSKYNYIEEESTNGITN